MATIFLFIFLLFQGFWELTLSFNVLDSLLKNNPFSLKQNDESVKRREELKAQLLSVCDEAGGGGNRERVEELIEEMIPLSPVGSASSTSPLLQKEWLLLWTTEKEINFFRDWNLAADITQTIDGGVLKNCIPFKNGGYLGVEGSLSSSSDEEGIRTSFEFTEATLDLGKFGCYKIPPIGKGWFDTVYLDDEFRIDTNSRNDILICRPVD
mmetsp:Transcript_42908/g.48747  ORF Transcript_42908/g.48747 Transcript_42908/m.48747 type:complete len:210 (+) Transcript_42908:48-677(+)